MQTARIKAVAKAVLNAGNDEERRALVAKVKAIEKEGVERPAKLPRDAKKSERKAHKEAMLKYNKYHSARYTKLKTARNLVVNLRHLSAALTTRAKSKAPTKAMNDAVAELHRILNDECPKQRHGESTAAYEKRKADFEPRGFKGLLSVEDTKTLDDAAKVDAEVRRVVNETKDLDVFLAKKDLETIRTSTYCTGFIGAVCQTVAGDLVTVAKKNNPSGIIKAADMLDLTGSLTEVFVRSTASYAHIAKREARRAEWEVARAAAHEAHKEKKRLLRLQAKPKGAPPKKAVAPEATEDAKKLKFEYPSFEEVEVRGGHAEKAEGHKEVVNGKEVERRDKYTWKNIDTFSEDEDYDVDFLASVKRLVDLFAVGRKVSKEARNFVSRVINDVCELLGVHCRTIVVDVAGQKTVTAAMAYAVTSILLSSKALEEQQKVWLAGLYEMVKAENSTESKADEKKEDGKKSDPKVEEKKEEDDY